VCACVCFGEREQETEGAHARERVHARERASKREGARESDSEREKEGGRKRKSGVGGFQNSPVSFAKRAVFL